MDGWMDGQTYEHMDGCVLGAQKVWKEEKGREGTCVVGLVLECSRTECENWLLSFSKFPL